MDSHKRGLSETRMMYLAGGVMMVLLVMSMSIRHAVLCENTMAESSEASLQLGRQTLEARLLNVEQEAMENSMLIEKVLRLLRSRHTTTSRFAEIFSNAEQLAVEIDAAFDSVDENIFAKIPERRDDPQRCAVLAQTYHILPQISWGEAPSEIQAEWRQLDCDSTTLAS